MNGRDLVLLVGYVLLVLGCAGPLGRYLAAVYEGRRTGLSPLLVPLERVLLRACGVRFQGSGRPIETGWRGYAQAMLGVQAVGALVVYLLLRGQDRLPLNPEGLPAPAPDLALDIAVSFVTNTNWQSYGGETTLSHFVQATALGVQNFVSAATGMAIAAALARGFARREEETIGNFTCDLVRGVVHVLLPLAVLLALALVASGVVQHLGDHVVVTRLEPAADGTATQVLPLGPVASQVAIKQLGTNGGGFFNVNSAHPFENPTALSNLLQCLAILLIPAAFCACFGAMVRDRRQGRALLAAMGALFVVSLIACYAAERAGNPALRALGVDDASSAAQAGGNQEGKEARFGIAASALWATATTAASNGSVNAMHDSFTPLGGLVPMVLMQLGEVVFGGVGSGLYGMVLFAIVAVFLAGLMVGRTPEYLGKKIGPFELKAAGIGLLAPAGVVLVGTAIALVTPAGLAGLQDRGAHGLSEVLYALSSAGNNNGSAFAGLNANSPFWNALLAVAMWIGRFAPAIPVLAIAGSLARKRTVAITAGTLPTHGPLFVVFLCAVVVLVGALTFLPVLVLGPIAEHLQLSASR
ncbi:MAG: potassium-transporting ATPase subunit KdpA [Planctomycetes bacterium]|nr:potassium-transporting ATPase subunit KdpA [Planctomycetota bacterium]